MIGPVCGKCGCGGGWHYPGCEAGIARGDKLWVTPNGRMDLFHKGECPIIKAYEECILSDIRENGT